MYVLLWFPHDLDVHIGAFVNHLQYCTVFGWECVSQNKKQYQSTEISCFWKFLHYSSKESFSSKFYKKINSNKEHFKCVQQQQIQFTKHIYNVHIWSKTNVKVGSVGRTDWLIIFVIIPGQGTGSTSDWPERADWSKARYGKKVFLVKWYFMGQALFFLY